MGQKQSKEVASNTSSISLINQNISEPRTPGPSSTPLTPLQDITPPALPRPITRISEIIDPRDLQGDIYNVTPTRPKSGRDLNKPSKAKAGLVHSPSGNILDTEEFLAHPNRPLAMWERQERVIQATKDKVAAYEAELANQKKIGARLKKFRSIGDLKGKESKRKRRCGCWPF